MSAYFTHGQQVTHAAAIPDAITHALHPGSSVQLPLLCFTRIRAAPQEPVSRMPFPQSGSDRTLRLTWLLRRAHPGAAHLLFLIILRGGITNLLSGSKLRQLIPSPERPVSVSRNGQKAQLNS